MAKDGGRISGRSRFDGIARGFAHGLGQSVGSPMASRQGVALPAKSPGESLRGDWEKLGGDMRRAAGKVMERDREAG
jgi:hypothetical protein